MSAISYSISLGQTLQQVVSGTQAPSAGSIELRMDQTATSITDAQSPTGTRALKRTEIYTLLKTLEEMLVADTTLAQ